MVINEPKQIGFGLKSYVLVRLGLEPGVCVFEFVSY